jgi:hypothetical protein
MPRALIILVGAASTVVAVAGVPVQGRLRRPGWPGWATALVVLILVCSILLGVALGIIFFSVVRLATELPQYATKAEALVGSVSAQLAALGVGPEQIQQAAGSVNLGNVAGVLAALLGSMAGLASNFVFLLALLLFLSVGSGGYEDRPASIAADRPGVSGALGRFAWGTRQYLLVTTVFGLIVAVLDSIAPASSRARACSPEPSSSSRRAGSSAPDGRRRGGVNTEALVLALSAVVRPTSAAAVVAMLSTRHPQRLLAAYLVAGLAFSVAVGALVVVLLGGRDSASTSPALRPVVDLVLGAGALGYAAGAGFGQLPRPRAEGEPAKDTWLRRRLRDLTPSGAAAAGVLTHLPGLVYLAALNAIVGTATGTVDGLLQVGIYNLIWFSLAIAALVLSVYRPDVSRDLLDRLASWTRRHRRIIIVVLSGALGAYLVVVGVLGLIDASS